MLARIFWKAPSNGAALAFRWSAGRTQPVPQRRPGRAGGQRQEPPRRDLGAQSRRTAACGRNARTGLQRRQAIAAGAVAVEDLAEGVDEVALFHLLNLAREQTAYLLLSARETPVRWPIRLPDLASRVRALPIIELTAPDDALLRAVMIKLFADRQLAVDESLIAYLIMRIERIIRRGSVRLLRVA